METSNLDHSSDVLATEEVREIKIEPCTQTQVTNTQFSDTVIFFDWDDTLFPTSFFERNGLHVQGDAPLSDPILRALRNCEDNVRTLILIAKYITRHVYIVTNASNGWVEHTAARYYPNLCADGTFSDILVVSARSQYSHLNAMQPMLWKYYAMHAIMFSINHTIKVTPLTQQATFRCNTVISVGDSTFERDAIRLVHSDYQHISLKVVKLIDKPQSCDHLSVQLNLISEWMMGTQFERVHLDLWTTVDEDLTVTIRDYAQIPPPPPSPPVSPPPDEDYVTVTNPGTDGASGSLTESTIIPKEKLTDSKDSESTYDFCEISDSLPSSSHTQSNISDDTYDDTLNGKLDDLIAEAERAILIQNENRERDILIQAEGQDGVILRDDIDQILIDSHFI